MDPRFQGELYVVEDGLPLQVLALIEDAVVGPHLVLAVRTHPVVFTKATVGHPALDTSERADVRESRLAADHEVELLQDRNGIDHVANIWR